MEMQDQSVIVTGGAPAGIGKASFAFVLAREGREDL